MKVLRAVEIKPSEVVVGDILHCDNDVAGVFSAVVDDDGTFGDEILFNEGELERLHYVEDDHVEDGAGE